MENLHFTRQSEHQMLKTSKRSHEKKEILQNPRDGVQKWWPDPPRALQNSSRIGSRIEPESNPKKYRLFTWPGEAQRRRGSPKRSQGGPQNTKKPSRKLPGPLSKDTWEKTSKKEVFGTPPNPKISLNCCNVVQKPYVHESLKELQKS